MDPERLTLTVLRWTKDGYLEPLSASSSEVVRAEPFQDIEIDLSEILDIASKGNR